MGKKTILIIDKDACFCKNIMDFLAEEQGFSVVGAAETGSDGLEMAKKLFPDIVIMGLLLDNIDGLSLIVQLKKMSFSPTIIVCSSLANDTFIAQAVESGASHYFTKPVQLEEVRQKLSAIASGDTV